MNIFDIPIITYHKISSQKEFGLTTIGPQIFKKQMELLAEKGFQAITFKHFASNQKLPQKPIIVSFDDTYKSIYENAFPIMKEFDFKGVLFVITNFIGKKNTWEAYPIQQQHCHANEDEISEMLVNGFEIGSHGKTHQFLPYLGREDIRSELVKSKQMLESTFETDVITCCYPYGGYNSQVTMIAKSTGYSYGMGNLKITLNNSNKQLCLQRRSIYSTDSLSTFCNKITATSKLEFNYISEWLIQKGAYAGILKNKFFTH